MNVPPSKDLMCWVIAKTLNKRIPSILISMSHNDLYDIVIKDKRTELTLVAIVGDLAYTNRPQFMELIKSLNNNKSHLSEDYGPVILICYDSDSENMYFGRLVSWSDHIPSVHKSITLRKLTPESWTILIDDVRIRANDFRFVDIDNILVIRHLFIEVCKGPRKAYGEIVYLRKPIALGSNITKRFNSDSIEKNEVSLRISDNEYPNDFLDELIFEAVKRTYPNTFRRSSVISNLASLEELDYLIDMQKIPFDVLIQPEDNILSRDTWNLFNNVGFISLNIQIFIDKTWAKNFFIKQKGIAFLSFEEWVLNYGDLLQLSQETFMNVEEVR